MDSTFVRAHFKWTAVSLFHRGMPVIHKYLFIDMSNKNTGIVISYHVELKLTMQSTENVSCDLISLFSGYNCHGYFVTFCVI